MSKPKSGKSRISRPEPQDTPAQSAPADHGHQHARSAGSSPDHGHHHSQSAGSSVDSGDGITTAALIAPGPSRSIPRLCRSSTRRNGQNLVPTRPALPLFPAGVETCFCVIPK